MAFGDDDNFLIKIEVDTSDVEKFKEVSDSLAKSLEKSGFWEPFDKAAKSAKDAGEAVETAGNKAQTSSKSFSSLGSAIIVLNQAVQLAQSTFRLFQSALQETFSQLTRASELEGLTQSFNNLQQTINATGEDTIVQLRESTKGLVSDFELLKVANNAVVLNVVRTKDELAQLTEVAIQLGRATGRDAVEAINDLSLGIGRQSRLILDNLGIVVKQEQVYKNLAATLGTTVENLTDAQKAEAFRTAAMEQAVKVASQLGAVQESAGISTQRLSATVQNLADDFALSFSSSTELSDAIDGLNTALGNVDAVTLGQQIGDLAAAFINFATGAVEVASAAVDKFRFSLSLLSKVANNPKALLFSADYRVALSEATKEQAEAKAQELNDTFTEAFSRVQKGQQILFETPVGELSAPFLAQLSTAVKQASNALAEGATASDEQRGALTDLSVVLGIAREQYSKFAKAGEEAEAGANRGKSAFDKLASAAESAANRFRSALTTNLGTNAFIAPVEQLAKAFQDGKISIAEFDAELSKLAKTAAGQGKKAVTDLAGAFQEVGQEVQKQQEEVEAYKKALEELGTITPEASSALLEAEKSAELLGKAFKAGIIDIQDLREELKKLGEQAGTTAADVQKIQGAFEQGFNAEDLGVSDLTNSLFGADGFFPLLSSGADRAKLSIDEIEAQFQNLQLADSVLSGLTSEIPAVFDTLSSELSSQDKFDNIAKSIGGALGTAIGGFFGGPAGAALGGVAGEAIGDAIGDIGSSSAKTFERLIAEPLANLAFGGLIGRLLFEDILQGLTGKDFVSDFGVELAEFFGRTEDEAETARQGVASFFKDLQKESKFKPIFFGEGGPFDVDKADFRQIQTVLEDGTETLTSGIEQKLEALNISDVLFQDFLELGEAFGASFEAGGEDIKGIAGQIGQVLALNLQDPLGLNDLQLLLQKAGLSAEELGKQLEQAYFNGDIAAGEFLTSTASINDLFAEGIPSATGPASVAFENFGFTALQSGQNAQDGLRDIGAEFLEAIIQLPEFVGFQVDPNSEASLQQLGQLLIAQGAEAQQVAVFLQVLEQQGIRTVEQLKNLDIPQTAAIVAKLQEVGFQFEEIGADVDATIEKIKQFRAEATKEIVTKYRIQVSVEGDSVPSGAADPRGSFGGQSIS